MNPILSWSWIGLKIKGCGTFLTVPPKDGFALNKTILHCHNVIQEPLTIPISMGWFELLSRF
jgi:hypothetical protein